MPRQNILSPGQTIFPILTRKIEMMKKLLLIPALLFVSSIVFAQPDKKPASKPPTSQPDMNKLLEDAMKAEGMSKEEQEEMKKLMKDVMPALAEHNATVADYPEFTSNKVLVPKRDALRISTVPKKVLTGGEVNGYAAVLYNKLMAKGNAAEMALVKKIIAQTPKAADIGGAAVLAMLQGHPQAAMALSMKAVQADPANPNWQNNMSALLTSYGYPEQAIPVLRKLLNDQPINSTILNNLGQAWLGLGETDSANRYFNFALMANPYHPESKTCSGLIKELKGDPVKAAKDYAEVFENNQTPFTDRLLKNNNGGKDYSDKLDFEKIKQNITIYEYFPKHWIKPPLLTPDVSMYSENYATKKGYEKMVDSLKEKVNAMADEAGKDLDNLAEQGEEEFDKQLAKDTLKGLSFMSKPATMVDGMLAQYKLKWMGQFTEEAIKLDTKISYYRDVHDNITRKLDGSDCRPYDQAANDLMSSVNPMVHRFYTEKAEEFRQWLNALITWNWYMAGNVKNIILLQDIQSAAFLAELYELANRHQIVRAPHCKAPPDPDPKKIDEPRIPNFTCPAVVSIPMGNEWMQLAAASKNFDDNIYGMKSEHPAPIPNHSLSYGIDHLSVAEPGAEPYFSSSEGSLAPSIPGPSMSTGKQLVELMQRYNEHLSNYFKIPREYVPGGDPFEAAASKIRGELLDLLEADRIREEGSRKFWETWKEMQDKKIQDAIAERKKRDEASMKWWEDYLRLKIERGKKEAAQNAERLKKELEEKAKKSERARKLLKDMMTGDCTMIKSSEQIKKYWEKMKVQADEMINLPDFGLQPSISSGVQAPGTFTVQKGLFN